MARDSAARAETPRRPKRISQDAWIDRAADYLLTNGVATFSVRAFAGEHKVSTQALINHFGSRDALIQKALSRAIQRDLLVLENITRTMTSVKDFFSKIQKELQRRDFRRMFAIQIELYATASLDREGHSGFAEKSTKRVHAIFESQIRREGILEERVSAVSSALVAFGRGMILEALGERTPEQLQELVDVIMTWYDSQLRAKG